MKKSIGIFPVLAAILSLLLVLIIFFQFQESNCSSLVNEIRNDNLTSLYSNLTFTWQNYFFFYINWAILNHTTFTYTIDNGTGYCASYFKNDLPTTCKQDIMQWPFEIENNISSLKEIITKKQERCDVYSKLAEISLYIVLVLSLILIPYQLKHK